jgi:hypothetical protein
MVILPDPLDEARRIVTAGAEHGLTLRLLGGLAIKLHSPSAGHRALVRSYPDLDFALSGKAGYKVEALLPEMGYEANRSFNLLNGSNRMLFLDPERERQVDVFIGSFHMCHTIPITERSRLEPLTLPIAELLLTKLQIFEMNEKDIRDVCALLLDHPLGESDAETINLARVSGLCADDWGLWKTVQLSLDKVRAYAGTSGLEPGATETLVERLAGLRRALDEAPKSLRWKVRARVGDRVKWYDLPEEVRRG